MAASNKIQVGYIEAQDGAQFQVDAGTAAAPGLCFDDSAATGLYSPGTGQIAWSTSGKQTALRILADGKVGVDCSPTVALEVNGTIKASAIDAPIEGTLDDWIVHAGDSNTKIGFPANDEFEVHTGGGPTLRIDSTGKLGINHSSPSTIIHAVGNGTVGTSVTMTLQSHDTANATAGIDLLARDNSNNNEVCKIQAAAGGQETVDLQFYTNNIEKLRITSDGKVGMGIRSTSGSTCNPDGNALLIRAATTVGTTKGHIMLTGDGATNGEGPQIVFSESGSGGNFAGAYVGHIREGSNSTGSLVFGTRNTGGDANTVPVERIRIYSTGQILYSAASGDNQITSKRTNAAGSNGDYFFHLKATNNSDTQVGVLGFHRDTATDDSRFVVHTRNTGGSNQERLRIDSNGDIFIGTTSDIAPTNGTNLCVSDATISRLILEKQSTIKYGLNVSNGFTIYDETNDAARFSIDSSGNLTAVNTTSGATTGVTLKVGASAASGTNSGTIIINNGGQGNASLQFDYENSAARAKIYTYKSTNDIIFDTSGTEKVRITSDGHLRVQGTYNGSSTTANDFPCLNINNLQGTYTANNIIGGVTFGKASGHTNGIRAGMLAIYQGNGSEAGNVGAHLSFRTSANGAGDSSEKLFITDTGVLCTGNYRTLLDQTMGTIQINGGSSGGRLGFRGTTTSQYGGLGEMHGYWDTNKVASILFHAGADTSNKDDGEIRMYTRPSGGTAAQRFRIDSTGVCLFGSGDTYASNSVSIHPADGMVNFGMDGRASLMTGQNSCYIFSGSGASGDMPAGSLVLQSRANVNRNILFATGDTPSLKWQIHGSTGALREYPYNTSTSSQTTSTSNGYHLRRVRNGQVPTGTSGNTYTLINTSTIADAGAYIIVLRSFEQNVTGGVLWSIRVVSSVFYLHHGSGNDGETVEIPVTYSGHANNATTQSGNGHGPVTLKIHFYNGSAHTAGKITITFNGFSYSGSNCDYYLYKLIDI